MTHLEVAVAAPVSGTLTYSSTAAISRLKPGIRILVPLGRRKVTGYLLGILPSEQTGFTVKSVTDLLDDKPLFPENMIPFFRWIADYYRYPLGEVIKNALPGGLTSQSIRTIALTEAGKRELTDFSQNQENKLAWLLTLLEKGSLSAAHTRKIWQSRKWQKQLIKWQEDGFLAITESISESSSKAKMELCARLCSDTLPGTDKLKLSEEKTLAIFQDLCQSRPSPVIPQKELNRHYSGAGKALKSLAEKGIITLFEQQIIRDPFGEEPPFYPQPAKLTKEQETALEAILPAVRDKKFSPFLLHGVTGSGKTEVYLQAAAETLKLKKTVLILVPEIALASQLEAHFFSRFGRQVALLHSGLSQGERFDQWGQIINGDAKIIIGARSAIFAPLSDPGLIIVDEEHDGAYKQEDSFRYQARDLAVLRGKLQQCPVVLGSASPSLTSFHHTTTGKYCLLSMTRRIEDRPLPQVTIIDLRTIDKNRTSHTFFSQELLDSLRENLVQGNQSIIFLNRRGYANLMICQDCGSPVKCLHCNISLTLHKGKKLLCCHHCGYTAKSAITCPSCRSARVKEIGFGTEKIEEALGQRFPKARIARLDRDTSTNRKNFLKILKAVHNREVDILVGTQMITKGHHFPHVTLVGVIWADGGLGMPDYKAGERTFQLISQVTGRAGRGDKPGNVIIQTHQPEHYAIICARKHDYHNFYKQELQLRQALSFPPFSRLVNLRFAGENEDKVREAAMSTSAMARKQALPLHVDVLGPAAAPLSKLRNKFRWQVILKGRDSRSLHTLCDLLLAHPVPPVRSQQVTMTVDIDPENMM
ncbi:MAG: primosomal protein N' [Desulfobulbaceae bacterium]|nr:primosomal protein N' [Desulfobulbaceae bacterium]